MIKVLCSNFYLEKICNYSEQGVEKREERQIRAKSSR